MGKNQELGATSLDTRLWAGLRNKELAARKQEARSQWSRNIDLSWSTSRYRGTTQVGFSSFLSPEKAAAYVQAAMSMQVIGASQAVGLINSFALSVFLF